MSQASSNYKDYTDRHRDIQFDIEWDLGNDKILKTLSEGGSVLSMCCEVKYISGYITVRDNRDKYYKAVQDYQTYLHEVYWNIMDHVS